MLIQCQNKLTDILISFKQLHERRKIFMFYRSYAFLEAIFFILTTRKSFAKAVSFSDRDERLVCAWISLMLSRLFSFLLLFHFSIKKVPRFNSLLSRKKSSGKRSTREWLGGKFTPSFSLRKLYLNLQRNFANFSQPSFNSNLFTWSCFRYPADFPEASGTDVRSLKTTAV